MLARDLAIFALAEVRHCAGLLDGEGALDRVENVHTLRVSCKKLRAYWQLLKPVVGTTPLGIHLARLRGARQALASRRDAEVLSQTLSALSEKCAVGERTIAIDQLRQEAQAHGEPPREELSLRASLQRSFAVEAAAWLRFSTDDTPLLPGLNASHRRARRRFKRARDRGGAFRYHRYRNALKSLQYQVQALTVMRRKPQLDLLEHLGRRIDVVATIGHLLGQLQDLAHVNRVLESSEALSSKQRKSMRKLLHKRQHVLQRKVQDLSGRLFKRRRSERIGLAS